MISAASPAFAGELEPADANALAAILRQASGIQEINYARVSCRWKGHGPTICAYQHANGARDSFAWFKAGRAANILLKYRAPVIVAGGLEEVAINNLECGGSICLFE